ncbi:MAG TPA: hypothetical protein VII98_12360 [Solirubrobacteraceae bacterium]
MSGELTVLAYGLVVVAVGVALVRGIRDPDGRRNRERASLDQITSRKTLVSLGVIVAVFLVIGTAEEPRRAPAAIFAAVFVAAFVGAIIWMLRRMR